MQTSTHSKLALAIGCLMALSGAVGAIGSWGAYLTDTRLVESGPRADGTIVRKQVLAAADGTSDYVVEYRFTIPSGEQLRAQRGVSKDLWSSLDIGATAPIVYSSADPRRNFPLGAGVTSLGVTIFVSAISLVVALLGGVLACSQWRSFRTRGRT